MESTVTRYMMHRYNIAKFSFCMQMQYNITQAFVRTPLQALNEQQIWKCTVTVMNDAVHNIPESFG